MKLITSLFLLPFLAACIMPRLHAQMVKPDLQNAAGLKIINRTAEPINEDGKKALRLSEAPGDGLAIMNNTYFATGTIEFDVKGKNVVQQSFVGMAFHLQDEKTYDAIYFRPFNFKNTDTSRRRRAVQYVSLPNYPWEKLRESFPGKYENRVNPIPNPDDWFHARIVVTGNSVSVFVNHSSTPSLEVQKLTNTAKGGVALWVGNQSGGSFANLTISNAGNN